MIESAIEKFYRAFLLILLINCCTCEINDETNEKIDEYCQHETMKGRCRWKSEVIVMTSARWGRMKTGRCLNIHPTLLAANGHDPLFLGCSADVLTMVDRKCSGRSECDIRIPDPELDTVTPCYPDQKSYLEASYTCVKVVQESRSCLVPVTNEPQFISSSSTLSDGSVQSGTTSCGSKLHPWRLEAPLGQRINISLLDFTSTTSPRDQTQGSGQTLPCRQYGYIVDKTAKKNVSICASTTYDNDAKLERNSQLYASDKNVVDVVLVSGDNENNNNNNFLVRINAIGCTNMVPPDNAWLKRLNNDVVIGCFLSQQTWHLTCEGHEWKGQVGLCPETATAFTSSPLKGVQVARPNEDSKLLLAIVSIAGGSVIVCVAVITVGVLVLRRCKSSYQEKHELLTCSDDRVHMSTLNGCPQSHSHTGYKM